MKLLTTLFIVPFFLACFSFTATSSRKNLSPAKKNACNYYKFFLLEDSSFSLDLGTMEDDGICEAGFNERLAKIEKIIHSKNKSTKEKLSKTKYINLVIYRKSQKGIYAEMINAINNSPYWPNTEKELMKRIQEKGLPIEDNNQKRICFNRFLDSSNFLTPLRTFIRTNIQKEFNLNYYEDVFSSITQTDLKSDGIINDYKKEIYPNTVYLNIRINSFDCDPCSY